MALEEEAQICRLCGQCESIYIDVFGEEGTKRYLGLKIHTKINILIDERDPLPKAICVQCLGKLEFVCDFQEECLRTQQLLRDRFNWPSPSDVEEIKIEDTPVSSMNNNSISKNQNPPDSVADQENGEDDSLTDEERNGTESWNGSISAVIEAAKVTIDEESVETAVRNVPAEELDVVINPVAAETTASTSVTTAMATSTVTAMLCNNTSQSVHFPNSKSNGTKNTLPDFDINNACRNAPIANRLRSHGHNSESNSSTSSQSSDKPNLAQESTDMIQIPTSTLNKVLTTVANSENMQVTVKESTGTSGHNEDINFIVELRHKEKTDFVTVLAKVFPDQGSCMVDRGAIVKLLENQNGSEIRAIVDKVFNRTNTKEDDDGEARLAAGRNPEDLFRMDGEEITVEENIEHVMVEKRSRYICRLCRKKYSRKDKCIVHVKTHLGIKQYLCTLCPAKFVCKSDVLKHIRSTHTNPRPFQCPKCPRRLRSKFDLTEHDNVHEGIKPYSCDECGLRYHHKVSLQMHAKSHLPSQNLACEYCGNVFPFRTRLLSHIASVHMKNRRNFRCHFCYNLYSSLSVLNDHIKSSHAATHVCEICGKEFKVKSKYKTHVLQHKNPRPFSCPVCNNKYASRTFLSEHLSKHQGLRKHVCQKCGATFAQASHLAAHRHVHGEKKYPCPDCGRRFNRQDNMKVHRKRHIKSPASTRPKEKQRITKPAAKDDNTPLLPIEKIQEDDGLSRKVCMRCIGTLEFVSDFHNKCHQTQRQLLLDKEDPRKLTKDEIITDLELDKENTAPRSNGEMKENMNVAPVWSNRTSCRMENKLSNVKKIEYKDSVFNEDAVLGSNAIENSKGNGAAVYLEAVRSSETRYSLTESKVRAIRRRETLSPRGRGPLTIKSREERTGNEDGREKVPIACFGRRKGGRKTNSSVINNENSKKSEKSVYPSHTEKDVLVGSKVTEACAIERVESAANLTKEEQDPCRSHGGRFLSVANEEFNKLKGTPPDGVKRENLDLDDGLVRTNELPPIPDDILILTPDGPLQKMCSESTARSPRPADEAGGMQDERGCDAIDARQVAVETSKIVSTEGDGAGRKSLPKASMIRRSVIESVKNGKTFDGITECGLAIGKETGTPLTFPNDEVVCRRQESNLIDGPENFGRSATTPQESLDGILSNELRESRNGSVRNFRERRKKSEGQFGKLSELITNEQREIIETLYTVNMDVVDDDEVYKNIKILDKFKVKCEICGKTYPRLDKCQVHVWGHLNMKPYCCKSCDFVTLTVSNIRCHIRKRHLKIKPFQCNLCEKTYGTAVLLEEHINSHTGAKPYKCKLCDFATSNRQVLSYHKTTHKPVKDISCEVCGKKFFSNCRMRAHMIVHNKNKSLMCKFCSTYLCNADALEKHYQKVHSRDYVCNICGVRTRSRKALTNHENVHSEAKYRCPLCSNIYKSKHMLKEHLLKHQGIRKYKCDLCQKSFAQQSHIAAHMSVHMGKRYPCPGCNKLFNRRDNMRIHTRRCKIVKSHPDMENLWISRSSTQALQMDDQPITVMEVPMTPNAAMESTENLKTDTEKLETGLGLLTVNLLTGKTDYSNPRNLNVALHHPRDPRDVMRDQRFDQSKPDDCEILRIGEVEIFPLQNSNAASIEKQGNTVITENILRPECF